MDKTLFLDTAIGGDRVDLRVAAGVITHRVDRASHPGLDPDRDEHVVHGGRITPPFAEPHVHLDAALLGERAPNVSGTLREGIANWARLRDELTPEDVRERALRTVEMYASYGCLRIRTHVDTGNLAAVEALIDAKHACAERGVELQVVAFPQEGILRARGRRDAWEHAVRMGCDAVGAIPHFERTTEEGWESVRLAFDLACELDRQVDLHCDETDDPGSRNLEVACALAIDREMGERVIAGHCTALHSYPDPHAAKVIELVATSGIQVVTNPLDNVVLQGRYDGYPRRRGITRVDELWEAGAVIGIGHDSVQDPWYRLGTANMLDPAYMLVHVGQLTSEAEMRRVFFTLSGDNHRAFGGPPALEVGDRAQLLHWADPDPVAILRDRSQPTVLR